jgi:hypothetical protein
MQPTPDSCCGGPTRNGPLDWVMHLEDAPLTPQRACLDFQPGFSDPFCLRRGDSQVGRPYTSAYDPSLDGLPTLPTFYGQGLFSLTHQGSVKVLPRELPGRKKETWGISPNVVLSALLRGACTYVLGGEQAPVTHRWPGLAMARVGQGSKTSTPSRPAIVKTRALPSI